MRNYRPKLAFRTPFQKDPRLLQRGGVGTSSAGMVELLERPAGIAEANRRVSAGRSVRLPGTRPKVDSLGDGGYCDWFFWATLTSEKPEISGVSLQVHSFYQVRAEVFRIRSALCRWSRERTSSAGQPSVTPDQDASAGQPSPRVGQIMWSNRPTLRRLPQALEDRSMAQFGDESPPGRRP